MRTKIQMPIIKRKRLGRGLGGGCDGIDVDLWGSRDG